MESKEQQAKHMLETIIRAERFTNTDSSRESLALAISALEKQEAKGKYTETGIHCESCCTSIVGIVKFCPDCGQCLIKED